MCLIVFSEFKIASYILIFVVSMVRWWAISLSVSESRVCRENFVDSKERANQIALRIQNICLNIGLQKKI